MLGCQLEFVESSSPQTHWWKPTPDYQRKVWWVIYNGQRVRQASEVEIDLWEQMQALKQKAADIVAPFDGFVLCGQTAEDALRKHFGLPQRSARFSTERKRLDQIAI